MNRIILTGAVIALSIGFFSSAADAQVVRVNSFRPAVVRPVPAPLLNRATQWAIEPGSTLTVRKQSRGIERQWARARATTAASSAAATPRSRAAAPVTPTRFRRGSWKNIHLKNDDRDSKPGGFPVTFTALQTVTEK